MQVCTFDYKNAKGISSTRVLVPVVKPSTMYAGIDISELDPEAQALFVTEFEQAHQDYLNHIQSLQNKFDLNYRYRQFKIENMTNLSTETI